MRKVELKKGWLLEWPGNMWRLIVWPTVQYLKMDYYWQFRVVMTLAVSAAIALVLWLVRNLQAWTNHDQPVVSFWKVWLVTAVVYTLVDSKMSQQKKAAKYAVVGARYAATAVSVLLFRFPAMLYYLLVAFLSRDHEKAGEIAREAVLEPFSRARDYQRSYMGKA